MWTQLAVADRAIGHAPNTQPALAAYFGGFSGSRRWGRGEELEEDAPRYEPVVVDEKAEDEAYPEHDDAEQKRIDDGAIGIFVFDARYHHGSQDPGGRPGREDDPVDPRHALLPINVNHHGRHDRKATAEAAQHVTDQNGEDPRIVLRHQDAKHDQLRGEQEAIRPSRSDTAPQTMRPKPLNRELTAISAA